MPVYIFGKGHRVHAFVVIYLPAFAFAALIPAYVPISIS